MIREIRERLDLQPFLPFTIYLADGRAFDVPHPEFLWLRDAGRLYFVHGPQVVEERINALLIVSIAPLQIPRKSRRR